ncbi:glycosyl transferase, family 2 [Leptolyngbya sp. NIES-2104]|nr:glycosyl transferase, family 2 [Leptolyngbya sp. NIES-2104]
MAGYAIAQILFIVFLWFNHINFPLNLEAMELLRVQHLQRLMQGLPLYPEPSSDFVALAYNPLSYVLTVPFAIVFGANLFTMRLVAILGMAGAGIVIFLAVRRQIQSNWWGMIAVGLFAAAYRVMDTYLDNAHAESLLLFSILLGCYLIDRSRNWMIECFAMLMFVAAFWFKQQGAIFAIAALIFLTWRSGFRKAWAYWMISGGLGAGLYAAMPDWVLGSRFHYFTWTVPRQWVEIQYWEVIRFLKLILFSYPVLAGVSLIVVLTQVQKLRHNIWYFMFPIAGLSGILATMTPGSNNNVYIPMGTWFIVVGVMALDRMMPRLKQFGLHFFAIALSFALFAYNPMSVIVSGQSQTVYQDFVSYLKTLPGTVYAPWIGQLQDQKVFSPSLHWVPLDDLVRGKNSDPTKHPPLEKLLQSVVQPKGKAYLLHNLPLEQDGRLSFLQQNYKLEADLGTRFQALRTLPKHYTLDYPRYLYRHVSK